MPSTWPVNAITGIAPAWPAPAHPAGAASYRHGPRPYLRFVITSAGSPAGTPRYDGALMATALR